MRLYLDEEEQAHMYSCLLAGGKVWSNMKKGLEKLERPTTEVDRELELNASLRSKLNPRAEETAREKERKDRAQQDWTAGEGVGSSGETGGGIPAGQTVVKLRLTGQDTVPTDMHIRDALMLRDDLVLMTDIASWTSSDRDAVVRYLNTEPGPDVEVPEVIDFVRMNLERVNELNETGPYTLRRNRPHPDADPTSYSILMPDKAQPDLALEVESLDDGVEAEVRVARMNRELIKHADIDPELIDRWAAVGPWHAEADSEEEGKPVRWVVYDGKGGDGERALSEADAKATAAKYNRTIAGKDEQGEWRVPPELEVVVKLEIEQSEPAQPEPVVQEAENNA